MIAADARKAEAMMWCDHDEWLAREDRYDKLRQLPREQLQAHLTLNGWVPVEAKTAALQRGTERVYIIAGANGLAAGYYEHTSVLPRVELPWRELQWGRILLMVERLCLKGLLS